MSWKKHLMRVIYPKNFLYICVFLRKTFLIGIEYMKIIDPNTSNYSLIYNATELKDELFFDQLELKPNSKFLLCGLKMTQCNINRFNLTYNWWYTYSSDGISFS